MKNVMIINGYPATVQFDPDIDLFRGEFSGLNGGADFYAPDVKGLRQEGERSLAAFLDECQRRGIEPKKQFSGKFQVRLSPKLHEAATLAATAHGESLNQWLSHVIEQASGMRH